MSVRLPPNSQRYTMVDPVTSTIISMWADGATAGQIAKTIGHGRNVVMSQINHLQKTGEITYQVRKSRIAAINARVEELERVRQGANFEPFVPPLKTLRISLVQLKHDSCRYIVEGMKLDKIRYCGLQTYNRSYCEHHYKLCYTLKPAKDKSDDVTT